MVCMGTFPVSCHRSRPFSSPGRGDAKTTPARRGGPWGKSRQPLPFLPWPYHPGTGGRCPEKSGSREKGGGGKAAGSRETGSSRRRGRGRRPDFAEGYAGQTTTRTTTRTNGRGNGRSRSRSRITITRGMGDRRSRGEREATEYEETAKAPWGAHKSASFRS